MTLLAHERRVLTGEERRLLLLVREALTQSEALHGVTRLARGAELAAVQVVVARHARGLHAAEINRAPRGRRTDIGRHTRLPRRPTDNNQQNGVITNTPRFSQLGGLSAPNKVGKTGMAVQKPGDGKKVI
jgi:hypothetical protein